MNGATRSTVRQGREKPQVSGRKAHVVFDMMSARGYVTGAKVYAEELAEALRARGQVQVTCISASPAKRQGGIWNVWNIVRHFLWTQVVLPLKLLRMRADLVHTFSFAPVLSPCPVILTLYDTLYLTHPEHYRNKVIPLYTKLLIAAAVRRANVLCTISKFSQREIASSYKVPADRIPIVYPGVSARYALPSAVEVATIRKKYSLPSKFFLFVGAWGRRKNLPRLIDAFRILLQQECGDLKLIMVGASSGSSEVEDRLRDPDTARHTSLLGFIPDEDMPPIYAACEALIFPSLGEGFGLPVIEAMACGTPVLLSRASCLPEVAGDAALYFDPEDPADMARAMSEFLHSDLSQDLRRRGLGRARLFDWNNAALESERIYAEVLR